MVSIIRKHQLNHHVGSANKLKTITKSAKAIPFLVFLLVSILLPSFAIAQDSEDINSQYTLRWTPSPGARYTYMLSSTGTRGESINVRTEYFEYEIISQADGVTEIVASGEPVPDGAPLAYRFQRALFPDFPLTIDTYGNTDMTAGQPFPNFINIPILPEEPVSEGYSWSGGPVTILPDANAGGIPFIYSSTMTSVANFRGEDCAVIETVYSVALQEDASTVAPFMGIVEGDPTDDQIGQGALVGGVIENSRAHGAGIQPGDLITEAEGQRIRGWGGLEDLYPVLVPEIPIEFVIDRGGEEVEVEFAPEGVPVAEIAGEGGLRSICFFSIERGIPLKIDLTSEELVFTLSALNSEEIQEREADIHFVLEYQYEGR